MRLGLFGGGTDKKEIFQQIGGGLCISLALSYFSYLTARYLPPFQSYKSHLVYSRIEEVLDNNDIEHPVIRECLKLLKIDQGISITHMGDLPAKSGLGGSSAFSVGLLNSLTSLIGQSESKRKLADLAIKIEREILNEPGGYNDQISSAFGGFNHIEFPANQEYIVNPIICNEDFLRELQHSMVLFYLGGDRKSGEISKTYTTTNLSPYLSIKQIAQEALQAINKNNLDEIGRLLNKSWEEKKRFSGMISNSKIDDVASFVLNNGAQAFKLCGAGNSGFGLCFIHKEKRQQLIDKMKEFIHINISINWTGSQIIFISRE